MSVNCEGKVALVTGASRGIGAAIARRLAAAGASVAAVARSLDRAPDGVPGTLRETVAAIEAEGGRAVAFQGDILDARSRESFMAAARDALGPIDILVNNATFGPYGPLEKFRERDIARTLESSVGAPLHLVQLALPDMRAKRRGWIPTSRPRRRSTRKARPTSIGSAAAARISMRVARPLSTGSRRASPQSSMRRASS